MSKKSVWSKDIWKGIALVALASAVIQAAVAIYVVFAFKWNIDVISDSAPICYADMADYDSIAAAQAIGRLDLISFLLTTGGILLGIFSFISFVVIRREAMEEARTTALEEAKRFLNRVNLEENEERTYNGSRKGPSSRAIKGKRSRASELGIPTFEDVPTTGAVREKPGEQDNDAAK